MPLMEDNAVFLPLSESAPFICRLYSAWVNGAADWESDSHRNSWIHFHSTATIPLVLLQLSGMRRNRNAVCNQPAGSRSSKIGGSQWPALEGIPFEVSVTRCAEWPYRSRVKNASTVYKPPE
jgi:hypothetical protein